MTDVKSINPGDLRQLANERMESEPFTIAALRQAAEEIERLRERLRLAEAVVEAAKRCMAWQTGSARVPFENRAKDAMAWEQAIAAYRAATGEKE